MIADEAVLEAISPSLVGFDCCTNLAASLVIDAGGGLLSPQAVNLLAEFSHGELLARLAGAGLRRFQNASRQMGDPAGGFMLVAMLSASACRAAKPCDFERAGVVEVAGSRLC